MKEVEIKKMQSSTRRTKFVIFGLVCIIVILAFNVYTLHRDKKELVRRKNFLVLRLRSYKEGMDKLTEGIKVKTRLIGGQERLLKEQSDQMSNNENEIRLLETANSKHRDDISKLKESALSSQESLKSLRKVHKDVSERLITLKSNFDNALLLCNTSAQETAVLMKQLAEKETNLQDCLKEKNDQQDKLEGARNTLNRRRELVKVPESNMQPSNIEQNTGVIDNIAETDKLSVAHTTSGRLRPKHDYTPAQGLDKKLGAADNPSLVRQPESTDESAMNSTRPNLIIDSPAPATNLSSHSRNVTPQSPGNETLSIDQPLSGEANTKRLAPRKHDFKLGEKVGQGDDIDNS